MLNGGKQCYDTHKKVSVPGGTSISKEGGARRNLEMRTFELSKCCFVSGLICFLPVTGNNSKRTNHLSNFILYCTLKGNAKAPVVVLRLKTLKGYRTGSLTP